MRRMVCPAPSPAGGGFPRLRGGRRKFRDLGAHCRDGLLQCVPFVLEGLLEPGRRRADARRRPHLSGREGSWNLDRPASIGPLMGDFRDSGDVIVLVLDQETRPLSATWKMSPVCLIRSTTCWESAKVSTISR